MISNLNWFGYTEVFGKYIDKYIWNKNQVLIVVYHVLIIRLKLAYITLRTLILILFIVVLEIKMTFRKASAYDSAKVACSARTKTVLPFHIKPAELHAFVSLTLRINLLVNNNILKRQNWIIYCVCKPKN